MYNKWSEIWNKMVNCSCLVYILIWEKYGVCIIGMSIINKRMEFVFLLINGNENYQRNYIYSYVLKYKQYSMFYSFVLQGNKTKGNFYSKIWKTFTENAKIIIALIFLNFLNCLE